MIDPVGVHVTPGWLFFSGGNQLPTTTRKTYQQQSVPAPVESGVIGLPLGG